MKRKERNGLADMLLKGELNMVEQALEQGDFLFEELDLPYNAEGFTPLISACQMGLTKVVHFLLEKGADMTLCDHSNQTALHVCQPDLQGELLSAMFRPLPHDTQLQHAAWQGDLHSLQYLLAQRDLVDVNSQNRQGLTPLMLAVRDVDIFEGLEATLPWEYHPVEVVRELLDASVDLDIQDHRGFSALQYAAQIKSPLKDELIDMMMEFLSDRMHMHMEPERLQECPVNSAYPAFTSDVHTNTSDSSKKPEFSECATLQEIHKDDCQDSNILYCFKGSMDTLREMRQDYKDEGKRSRATSLPSLLVGSKGMDKSSTLNNASEFHSTRVCSYTPVPPRVKNRSKSIQQSLPIPQFSQLSQSAPSLMEPLLDTNALLQARANINNRLRISETTDTDRQKGSLLTICKRPIRTPKLLAPLERGQWEGPLLSKPRHLVPLKPVTLLPVSSICRRRRERFSKRNLRGSKSSRGGSEESTSSSTSSQGSLDLEGEESGYTDTLQESRKMGRTSDSGSQEASEVSSQICNLDSPVSQDDIEIQECFLYSHKDSTPIKCSYQGSGTAKDEMSCDSNEPSKTSDTNSPSDTPANCKDEEHPVPSELTFLRDQSKGRKDSEVATSCVPNFDAHKDIVRGVRSGESDGEPCCTVDTKHKCLPKVNITISGPASKEKSKPVKTVKSKDRRYSTPFQTNHSFNILANIKQNKSSAQAKNNRKKSSISAHVEEITPPDLVVSRAATAKALSAEASNTTAKIIKKNKDTQLAQKRVSEPQQFRRSSADSISFNNKAQSQKQLLKRNFSARQAKKQGILGTTRAKSAIDYITYNDMFQEISQGNEGPAIFEMFATPVYENLQAASSLVRSEQVQPGSQGQRQIYGKHRSSKTPEGGRRKKTLTDRYSQAKGKQRKTKDVLPKRPHHQAGPFDGKDNVVMTCGLDRDVSEITVGEENRLETQVEMEGSHPLSVIEEVLSHHKSGADFFEAELGRNSPASTQKNFTSHLDTKPGLGIHEMPSPLSKTDSTEAERNKSGLGKDSTPNGFLAQPMINTWTSESNDKAVSLAYQSFLDEVGEGPLTDDLLQCLAEELISLEEKEAETLTPQKSDSEKNNPHLKIKRPFNKGITSSDKSPQPGDSCVDDAITWTKGEVLGRGAYGTVYCGLTNQGQLIAVKQVVLDASDTEAAEKEYNCLEREVDLLKSLHHPNIVGFLGTALSENVVCIFMEYVPGGSISSILHRFGPLPETVLALYTRQILEGVAYLHANWVIHRDLKGSNVMLMPTGIVKLIDFGCARRLSCLTHTGNRSDLLKSVHGTPYWMAPEVINETGHGRKSDVWSVGCTVFEMATGKPPLAHMDKMAALFYIGARKGLMPSLPDEFSEEAKNFVQACLTSDQKLRPTAEDLLRHPFLPKLKGEELEKPT